MFCPTCGSDERHSGPFCRACGTDLACVRTSLEQPVAPITAILSPRDEIARAIAYKISQLDTAKELSKVTEDVLPELEKFLESPQQKRLRRMRAGIITAMIGLGATIFFTLMSTLPGNHEMFGIIGVGITTFLIGLGIVINAKWFTLLPESESPRELPDAMQTFLNIPAANTNELPPYRAPVSSVTEHTTHRLSRAGDEEMRR